MKLIGIALVRNDNYYFPPHPIKVRAQFPIRQFKEQRMLANKIEEKQSICRGEDGNLKTTFFTYLFSQSRNGITANC
jgi:hypothetical protein